MRLRTLLAAPVAALALTGLTAAPAQANLGHFPIAVHVEQLGELNDSGVRGHVIVIQTSDRVSVILAVRGLERGQVHLQHIHGFIGGQEAGCPGPELDTNGDGFISFSEGLPAYGPPVIVLGDDVTPRGRLVYLRSFTETSGGQPVSALGQLADYSVVVHGLTVFGAYEVTAPVACAELDALGRH